MTKTENLFFFFKKHSFTRSFIRYFLDYKTKRFSKSKSDKLAGRQAGQALAEKLLETSHSTNVIQLQMKADCGWMQEHRVMCE